MINERDFYEGWTLVYRKDNKFKLGYISESLMEKDPQILGPLIKSLAHQMQQAMQRGKVISRVMLKPIKGLKGVRP